MITKADKLKKFLIEELGVINYEDFTVFDNTRAGSKSCEGFKCPEELMYSTDKCSKCKYNSFWEKGLGHELPDIINDLKDLKKINPELEISMKTPEGKLSCKIKNALIYETKNGNLRIDSKE